MRAAFLSDPFGGTRFEVIHVQTSACKLKQGRVLCSGTGSISEFNPHGNMLFCLHCFVTIIDIMKVVDIDQRFPFKQTEYCVIKQYDVLVILCSNEIIQLGVPNTDKTKLTRIDSHAGTKGTVTHYRQNQDQYTPS
jgi:hypothetical protein